MTGYPPAKGEAILLSNPAIHNKLLTDLSSDRIGPPTMVALSSLVPADSPRLEGVNAGHAEALAEMAGELPPVLVHRQTMKVIDGMHRLLAARMRGQDKISAQFFDGAEEDAFLLAVSANIKHGLPLSLADRRAAAARIMRQRPDASDRWIAEVAGVAAKTVAAIRKDADQPAARPARRIGKDGRVRPLTAAEGRRIAGKILRSNPGASLRQIARDAGISVGTARDVRERVRQGIDPVIPKQRTAAGGELSPIKLRRVKQEADLPTILRRLRQDPAIRYSESGRRVLSWLSPPRLMRQSDWDRIIDLIPPHCTFDVIHLAHSCALAWCTFAEELERRIHHCEGERSAG